MAFFIAPTCDGCSACLRQCPTAAIGGVEGALHTIDARLCIDCGVCGEICPVQAVFDQHGRLCERVARDQRLRPVVDLDLCNGCRLCLEFCPFDCLAAIGPKFYGAVWLAEPHSCVSCGDCATACIKRAVRMKPLDLRSWLPDAARERARTHLLRHD